MMEKPAPSHVEKFIARWHAFSAPPTEGEIAAHFTGCGPWRKRLVQHLEMLVTIARASKTGDNYFAT